MTGPAGQPADTVTASTVARAGCPAAPSPDGDLGGARAVSVAVVVSAGCLVLTPVTVAVACGGLAYLALRTVGPDLTHYRIPRGPCWQAGLLGAGLAAAAAAGGSVDAAALLGTVPTAGILLALLAAAWWLGVGGFGDVRLVAALAALTVWWVTPVSIIVGFGVCAAVAAATALARRQRAIPAGPALWSLFAAAAATTLLAPVA